MQSLCQTSRVCYFGLCQVANIITITLEICNTYQATDRNLVSSQPIHLPKPLPLVPSKLVATEMLFLAKIQNITQTDHSDNETRGTITNFTACKLH